jgi:hypothetical protein
MPNKFGRSDDGSIQNTPKSVSTSIGVTLAQINNTFLRRDGSNTVVGDINIDKHKLTHLGEPSAYDDAVTKKYVNNSSQTASAALTQLYREIAVLNVMEAILLLET